MRRSVVLVLLLPLPLLLLLPARSVAAELATTIVELHYDGYGSGFRAIGVDSEIVLSPAGYRISMAGHTAGMIGMFFRARWQTVTEGLWASDGVAPRQFINAGTFGGNPRRVVMAFAGGNPVLQVLQPANDHEHQPVPPETTLGAIDPLSVTALLVREVAMAGQCSGRVDTFDGREVEDVTIHGDGPVMLPASSRSPWHGEALRCALDTVLLAGFPQQRQADSTALRHQDAVWLGQVLPGVPPLPVRILAHTRQLGATMLYLTAARLRDRVTAQARP